MKILGSVLIVFALSFIGRISSQKLSKRVEYIKIMIHALEFIKKEIAYNMTSLKNLFRKLSNNSYFQKTSFFEKIYLNLLNDNSFNQAWNLALGITDFSDILVEDELTEIGMIGSWLGTSSAEEQISSLDSALNFLKLQLIRAQEEKQKYYKIYSSFGILFGFTVVILIW